MKKLFAFILTLALSAGLAGAAAIAAENAASVALTSFESYTSPISTSDSSVVAGFEKLVLESKKSSVKESDVTKLARFELKYASGKTDPRTVYKAESGDLYIDQGKNLRGIKAQEFYKLADDTGRDFYKYRPIPRCAAANIALPVVKSEYSFKKLDGLFYKTQYTASAAPKLAYADVTLSPPEFGAAPKSARVTVFDPASNKSVFSGDTAEFLKFKPAKSGDYRAEITASYDGSYTKGDVTYAFIFSYEDEISFSVDGAGTYPGEVVILRAKNIPEGSSVSVETDISFKPAFFRENNGDMIALLPISYYVAPGKHYVKLSCGDKTGHFEITTGEKTFTVQNLTVPPATAQETINSQKANDEYEKYIAPIRFTADGAKHWEGRFIWPLKVERRVTTPFGTIRYTNGGSTPSRHGAIDFAAAQGTPVYASGAGRVLFAGYLQLTGNTVVIEHGYGLKTWYYHMSALNVKTGESLKQDQKIGAVGSTGFSTGAHLHFGMSVNNVFVNPETSIDTDLFR